MNVSYTPTIRSGSHTEMPSPASCYVTYFPKTCSTKPLYITGERFKTVCFESIVGGMVT